VKEVLVMEDGSSIEVHRTEETGDAVKIGIVLSDDVVKTLIHDNAMIWEDAADALPSGLVLPAELRDAVLNAVAKHHYRGVFTQLDIPHVVDLLRLLTAASDEVLDAQEAKAG
jgi:hypothetical protein